MLKIKELRTFKNYTQDDVVAKTGIKKRTYVDYENQKQDIPLSKLQIIAKVLNVSVSELIGETTSILEKSNNIKYDKQYKSKNYDSESLQRIGIRLAEICKWLKVSLEDFAKKINIDYSEFMKMVNGENEVPSELLDKIEDEFPEINPIWIHKGKGDIRKDSVKIFKLKTDQVVNQSIPLYDLEVTAGLVELFRNHEDIQPIDTINIPNLPKCDGAVFVTGDSMYPLLKSGDIVMYKEVQDIYNNIFWGQMYLISVDVDDDEYIMVKYIQKSDKGDKYITLVSQNKHHQDKVVHLKNVRALALVKASIRINAMS